MEEAAGSVSAEKMGGTLFGHFYARCLPEKNVNIHQLLTKKSVSMKVISWLFLAMAGILTFLLTESWIIGLVALFGATGAFFILSTICTCISFAIVYFYNNHLEAKQKPSNVSRRIQVWITKKEESLNPTTLKLAQTSKFLALIFSTLAVGPLLTTIAVKVLGYKKWIDYTLSFLSSILFSLVWVAIYSGTISMLKGVLGFIL